MQHGYLWLDQVHKVPGSRQPDDSHYGRRLSVPFHYPLPVAGPLGQLCEVQERGKLKLCFMLLSVLYRQHNDPPDQRLQDDAEDPENVCFMPQGDCFK